jgi:hypothetical protein
MGNPDLPPKVLLLDSKSMMLKLSSRIDSSLRIVLELEVRRCPTRRQKSEGTLNKFYEFLSQLPPDMSLCQNQAILG